MDTSGCPSAELWCQVQSLSFVLSDASPFVMIPAAAAGAVAGVFGRRRLAIALLAIAVLALIVPIGLGMWGLLIAPMT